MVIMMDWSRALSDKDKERMKCGLTSADEIPPNANRAGLREKRYRRWRSPITGAAMPRSFEHSGHPRESLNDLREKM